MKQGKQLTLGKRILRNVLIFLSGVLGAGILAFLAGFLKGLVLI